MLVRCLRCDIEKPITEYGADRSRSNGLQRYCRLCQRARATAWRHANPELVKSATARSYGKWREKHPKMQREPLVTAEGRLCRTCDIRKPDDSFGRDVRGITRRAWRCKECARKAHLRWSEANREHVRDVARGAARKSRSHEPSKSRESLRRYRLKSKYGLSLEQVSEMLEGQNGRCSICTTEIVFTHERVNKSAAHVDHNHDTGKVRGLLCSPCNTALGKFKDSADILRSAISYLEKHSG